MNGPDLFSDYQNRRSTPAAPVPWPSCDTYSEEWRLYCSAWQRVFMEDETTRMRAIRMITEYQGEQAGAALRHNIAIVERERQKMPSPELRARLPEMLKRAEDMPKSVKIGRRR